MDENYTIKYNPSEKGILNTEVKISVVSWAFPFIKHFFGKIITLIYLNFVNYVNVLICDFLRVTPILLCFLLFA